MKHLTTRGEGGCYDNGYRTGRDNGDLGDVESVSVLLFDHSAPPSRPIYEAPAMAGAEEKTAPVGMANLGDPEETASTPMT